jgi:colanic acid biosynthesis glycosyl transferase WcaI
MAQHGHDVTVLCSTRAYDGGQAYARSESRDGFTVRRIHAFGFGRTSHVDRILDYASFTLGLLFRVLTMRPRPDIVFSLTTPPFLGAFMKFAARIRGFRHGHWLMDLYPDVMIANGMVRDGSLVHRALCGLTRYTLRGSAVTLSLGPAMAERAARYCPAPTGTPADPGQDLSWIPLWGDLSPVAEDTGKEGDALRLARGWASNELVLMYSGNMGLGHRFDEICSLAKSKAGTPNLRWGFSGGGKRLAEIRTFAENHPDVNVEIMPYSDPSLLRQHLCSADVHLVSLQPAWQGCMVPSKLFSIFTVGRPVIFVGPDQKGLAQWIRESKGGWIVSPGDIEGLANAISEARDAGERARRGENARAYALKYFDRSTNCTRIRKRLEEALGA